MGNTPGGQQSPETLPLFLRALARCALPGARLCAPPSTRSMPRTKAISAITRQIASEGALPSSRSSDCGIALKEDGRRSRRLRMACAAYDC